MVSGQFKNNELSSHLYYWNMDAMKYLIKKHTKFNILEIKTFTAYYSKNILFRMVCSLLHVFNTDMIVVMKK
jgi:hypothetical protein